MISKTVPQRPRQPILARSLGKRIGEPVDPNDTHHTMGLLGALLDDAVRENASDIHVDPNEAGYQRRFPIDGALLDTLTLDQSEGKHIVRSCKAQAGLDPAIALAPQDGR